MLTLDEFFIVTFCKGGVPSRLYSFFNPEIFPICSEEVRARCEADTFGLSERYDLLLQPS
jgi:hypothetical protein